MDFWCGGGRIFAAADRTDAKVVWCGAQRLNQPYEPTCGDTTELSIHTSYVGQGSGSLLGGTYIGTYLFI